ncbi:hypothetical protein [Streptomyces candidus]|uniref:Uncharacterized protein n=1 Tax=Streptomyces candidus TaxID=67283 RepID=A0A7X0HL85_9ACTN|nr:hypothetical protein [Streptomyces candidus]MBB6439565.1 hypothetical protein [Streptomyces candidus]GHH54588.1 hypothetical protein GCM10018773_57780 [Streptomyces candidus]
MRTICTLPLTRAALDDHHLADRDEAHELGRCTRVYASQNPAPVRAATPRAQEITAR